MDKREAKVGQANAWAALLCLSAAYVILGALLLCVQGLSLANVCTVLGVVLIVAGVVSALSYFLRSLYREPGHYGFALGCGCAVLGLLALLRTTELAFAFSQILALCVLGDSILKLQYATDLLRLDARRWWIVLLVAGVGAALAILALVDPFPAGVRLPFTYALLIGDGIANVAVVLCLRHVYRQQDKQLHEQPLEQ